MSNLLHLSLLVTVLGDPATAANTPAPPAPGTHIIALPRHNFTLPEGFDVTLAADPP